MAGLVDIAPRAEVVVIRDTEITVTGIAAHGIAALLSRFPELRRLMAGAVGGEDVAFDGLMSLGGDIVCAVLAAGTGASGDAEAEQAAAALTLEEQAELLAAVMRQTAPRGLGPLVERLGALLGEASSSGPVSK